MLVDFSEGEVAADFPVSFECISDVDVERGVDGSEEGFSVNSRTRFAFCFPMVREGGWT